VVVELLIAAVALGAGPVAAPPAPLDASAAAVAARSPSADNMLPSAGPPPTVMDGPLWHDSFGQFLGTGIKTVEPLPPTDRTPPAPVGTSNPLLENYYDPFGNQFLVGQNSAQPYRLNWFSYDDFTYIPTSPTRGVAGSFQDLEWNAWMRRARTFDRYLVIWTPTWNSSFWTGPSGVALPPDADQIRSDIQVSSLYDGRWNWQVGFTPQINADFRRSLDSNAYMFDGRVVLFYQASAQWRLAMGAAYWNRVTDLIIPYGGVIWTPNDQWELRLLFPKARISRYWGRVWGKNLWTYGTLGYDLQAWQVGIQDPSHIKTRMQMSSNQALLGTSVEWRSFTAFAEGGLIFDRHVRFRAPLPSFGIQDALMLRIGAMY
jgi:hypothetical protein